MIKPQITGIGLTSSEFRVHETQTVVDIAKVFDVLNGRLAAYRIHDFVSQEVCRQIVDNFWASPQRAPRYGEGEYGVEGYFIGASHIEKTTLEYLEDVRAFEPVIHHLFVDSINPLRLFRQSLIKGNSPYVCVRPAQYEGLCAGDLKAVYWSNVGPFLLQPHDDYAQLRDPRQHGFEIQQATRVMAVNFYAVVPENAGQLKVWNIEPDDLSRAALNLTYSGFPYPPELLDEFENITIPVEAGELCVLNGNLVHAVMRGDELALSKDRLLVTCFMTFNDKNELIWWT